MRNRQHGAFVLWTSLILSLIAIDSPLFVGASRDESASDEASTSSLKEGRRTRANEVFSIGNNHYQKKEFNDAIQQYKIAINLNPDVISYYSNLGNCLREVSEYEESIRILQKAVFLNEEHSKSWYNLGVTYQTMGLYIDAISSYNNATMLTPDYLNAHYNKGSNLSLFTFFLILFLFIFILLGLFRLFVRFALYSLNFFILFLIFYVRCKICLFSCSSDFVSFFYFNGEVTFSSANLR